MSKSESRPAGVHHVCRVAVPLLIGSRMSEHRGREVSVQKGPAHSLDPYFLMAVGEVVSFLPPLNRQCHS